MNKGLTTTDIVVFIGYIIAIAVYGYWIYKRKKEKEVSSTNFFLAEGQLTWWAIGASLIASNISAEQFIGMSGNGFRLGLAIASYEWLAAISLVIVAVFFMPIYLKNKIFTMPQFLKTRYNETVAIIMAIFWLFLYVTVNLLYLGTIALNNLVGGGYFQGIMILLALFSLFITLGGMKVIGFTDVIQVLVLIIGGLVTTYIALTLVSEKFGLGKDMLAGFNKILTDAPDHFKMIFDKPTAGAAQKEIDNYVSLPGIAMLVAGQWIANLNYWGCNQYITQRALGANLKTARTGILFSAFLKLLMPIIVVLPGIAAYVLYKNGGLQAEMSSGGEFREDNAYAAILNFLPSGLKGLSMAALTAAIVASLAGKANSISTIFSLDIYKKYFNKTATDRKLVWVGRIVIVLSLLFAVTINWNDLLGIGGKGGFEFIQKYTGYVSPVIFAVFLLGFFWKRTTSTAAIIGIVTGTVLAIVFDKVLPLHGQYDTILYTAYPNAKGEYGIPFLIQMGWVFFFTCLIMIVVSLLDKNVKSRSHTMEVDTKMFALDNRSLILAVAVVLLVIALYLKFW
jgi:solute:Na+ symporter, SSS family